ncbi:uncharacterized protein [Physcomitrium patens]|uniref:uncharacterized protein isoform X2 n=1 Tax=Physcomitrium patens TaxID=3218 RepID=UPI003CCD4084
MSDIALGVVGFGGQGCQSMLVTHIDLHIGGSSREALGNWTNVRRKGCWHGEQETGLCLGSRADRKNESRQVRLAEEDVNLFAGHEP